MLQIIKVAHTLVWVIMASAVFYIVYVGISGNMQGIFWIALGLITFESAVLIYNKWRCPLSNIAEHYTTDQSDNFDIYLPIWLAKHNKIIFTFLLIAGLSLVLLRHFLVGWS